jgi:glycerol-3-phosphate acyltransferase PlsY
VFAFNLNGKEPTIPAYIALSIVIAALAIYQHRSNLARLMSGKESKFGDNGARIKDQED